MLATGQWVKLTTSGLASKSLAHAFREHRYAQAKQQRQPFAVALSGVAGTAKQIKGTMVTPFQFVPLAEEACPVALGWAIRERWDEVLTWRGTRPSRSPTQPDRGPNQALVYGNGEPVAHNQAECAAFRANRRKGRSPVIGTCCEAGTRNRARFPLRRRIVTIYGYAHSAKAGGGPYTMP